MAKDKPRTLEKSKDTFHARKISHFRLFFELFGVIFVIIYAVIKKNLARIIPSLRRPKIDFRGKVVLLTGAGGGFGRRLAERLAERGAVIACVDVDDGANQRCVAAANRAAAGQASDAAPAAHAFRANLVSRGETQKVVQEVENKLGRIDILIPAAVCYSSYNVLGFDDGEIDFIIDLNFKTVLWLVRAVLPGMKTRGFGQIAVLSSTAGLFPPPGLSMYAACKGALGGYMTSLYYELRKEQVDVGVTILYPYFSPTSPIVREASTSRIPDLDPDAAVDRFIKAIEDREVHLVLPWYMSGLAGIFGIFPQEAIDYLSDVAGVQILDKPGLMPKATVTVDKWVEAGASIFPHDRDEATVVRRFGESSSKSV